MSSISEITKDKEKAEILVIYGIATFIDNKVIILKDYSDDSEIIEDNTVSNEIYFDKLISYSNKIYISYITLSGIRRYSLIKDNDNIKAKIKKLEREKYKWDIFKIYKYHYIDNYIKPNNETNNKKSLSTFIKTLEINIQPKPLGLCAQFIHYGLNVAGFKFQGKFSAKLYHLEGLLKELGFREIPYNSELKKGDIAVVVYQKLVNYKNYYGHICAWDGKDWLCDERKNKIFGDSESIHYYRYDLWEE